MKLFLFIPFFIFFKNAVADDYRSMLDQSASIQSVVTTSSSAEAVQTPAVTEAKPRSKKKWKAPAPGNTPDASGEALPNEYFNRPTGFVPGDKAVYVSVKKGTLNGILKGAKFEAVINEAITVSQSVPNPVSGMIVTGVCAGSTVVGEARLDKDLHRVLIDFTSIVLKDKKETYSFKGSAFGDKGVGLYGDYHTTSGLFMIGEFAAAAAAGFSDAQIDRSTTLSGGYIAAPTVTNAAMSGLTASLAKTSDKFAQGASGTSDHTDTEPFQKISVIVTEEPVLKE